MLFFMEATSIAQISRVPPSFGHRGLIPVVVQKLLDEVHVGQQHAAAAVALQPQLLQRVTEQNGDEARDSQAHTTHVSARARRADVRGEQS